MKSIYKQITAWCGKAALALPVILLASCNYLDVAPVKRAGFDDAMKDKDAVVNWLQSCYEMVGKTCPRHYSRYESSVDEFVLPQLWGQSSQQMAWNQISPNWVPGSNVGDDLMDRWSICYGDIGHCHLFLRELERQTPLGVTEEDRIRYRAEVKFLKAYGHFMLLILYGPIPIMNEYADQNKPKEDFPGRSHFDYVVDYIVNLLDEAAADLPSTYALDETWGRANAVICKAVKARVLLYAASPLFNGSYPYPNWKNLNYETPGYGKELISHTYDPKKWERALQACKEAITFAEEKGGRKLLDMKTALKLAEDQKVPLPYVPGVSANDSIGKDFLEHVLLMRYVTASDETQGNTEYIFGTSSRDAMQASYPRRVFLQANGQWWNGYSGISPTLYTAEHFYTADGKLPEKDPKFVPKANWLKSANVPGREEIINLNVHREPRFYAWLSFDGDDYGSLMRDGQPFRINLRDKLQQGYNPSLANRDQNQTGYFSKKFVAPNIKFTSGGNNFGKWYPSPLIRLAGMYLDLAECQAETGDVQGALKSLNVIRTRAGVPELTTADITNDMTLRDWVRSERFIELWYEGSRYYDLRRWMTAPQFLGTGTREGLDVFQSGVLDPSFDQLNRRVTINQPFAWDNRMYFLPVRMSELYSNPQLIQVPGY